MERKEWFIQTETEWEENTDTKGNNVHLGDLGRKKTG